MQVLDRSDAERILGRNTIGRLGCYVPTEDRVYVVPISYRLAGQTAYFGCLPGKKVDCLVAHPSGVCLEVDQISDEQDWVSVIATGICEQLKGFDYYAEERRAIGRASRGPLRWTFLDDNSPSGHKLVLFALRIEEITGRRDSWWAIPEHFLSETLRFDPERGH